MAGKALTIAATIFISVFITVLLANQPSQRGLGPPVSPFETSIEAQIFVIVHLNSGLFGPDADKEQNAAMTEKLRTEMGLNLPFLPRYMLWTVKALTFDWGRLGNRQGGMASARVTTASASDIILQYLPNTLLLIGTAYLLVFLIGMPLALYLARNYGGKLDRLFAALSPISSVPSWVIGILLISIFAFQLRWLPFSGMYDSFKPDNPIEYLWVVSKHMILPVAAILISLLFQMVYMWRTFFVIYSEEDYVDLARAKGLSFKALERKYILWPTLPYIITGFVISLISFWQLSMALEAVFRWPGLGWLYIKEALPNFWGESMEPGELIIVIGIVVIFACLLGATVFILDFVYVLIDPRIRLMPTNDATQTQQRVKSKRLSWHARFNAWRKRKNQEYEIQARGPVRRDLIVPLFWGMPFALFIGLFGMLLTTLVAMLLPAIGVWFGGWVDNLIRRLTEINMLLPSLPIAVLTNVLFGWNIWVILAIMVVLNTFGSPIKTLRSAFLQAKEAPYIESARTYGASDFRIITHYLMPRILPVLIPMLITQVPSFIFFGSHPGVF